MPTTVPGETLTYESDGREKTETDETKTDTPPIVQCDVCPEDVVSVAVYKCVQCNEHYCEDCSVCHRRQKYSRDHQLESLTGSIKQVTCSEHREIKAGYFCTPCRKGVCDDCRISNHTDHDVRSFEELCDKIRVSLKKDIDEPIVRFKLAEADLATAKMLKLKEEMEQNREDELKKIESRCDELQKIIDDLCNSLKTELTSRINPTIEALDLNLANVHEKSREIQKMLQMRERLLTVVDEYEIVIKGEELIKQLKDVSTLEIKQTDPGKVDRPQFLPGKNRDNLLPMLGTVLSRQKQTSVTPKYQFSLEQNITTILPTNDKIWVCFRKSNYLKLFDFHGNYHYSVQCRGTPIDITSDSAGGYFFTTDGCKAVWKLSSTGSITYHIALDMYPQILHFQQSTKTLFITVNESKTYNSHNIDDPEASYSVGHKNGVVKANVGYTQVKKIGAKFDSGFLDRIATSSSGKVYVRDVRKKRIVVFSPNGEVYPLGKNLIPQDVIDLKTDSSNRLLVLNNKTIHILSDTETVLGTIELGIHSGIMAFSRDKIFLLCCYYKESDVYAVDYHW